MINFAVMPFFATVSALGVAFLLGGLIGLERQFGKGTWGCPPMCSWRSERPSSFWPGTLAYGLGRSADVVSATWTISTTS